MLERIPCAPRAPRASAPEAALRLRVDPAAFGRGTRRDLEQQGYAVHPLRTADAPPASGTVLYFMQPGEAPPRALLTTQGLHLIVCPVGEAPAHPELEELCRAHGHTYLPSRLGPSLNRVLEALARAGRPART